MKEDETNMVENWKWDVPFPTFRWTKWSLHRPRCLVDDSIRRIDLCLSTSGDIAKIKTTLPFQENGNPRLPEKSMISPWYTENEGNGPTASLRVSTSILCFPTKKPKSNPQFPPRSHFLFHLPVPVTLIRTPQSFNSKKTQKIPLWGRLRRPLMIDQLRNANNSTRLGMDVNKTQPPPLYISFSMFLSRQDPQWDSKEMKCWSGTWHFATYEDWMCHRIKRRSNGNTFS